MPRSCVPTRERHTRGLRAEGTARELVNEGLKLAGEEAVKVVAGAVLAYLLGPSLVERFGIGRARVADPAGPKRRQARLRARRR